MKLKDLRALAVAAVGGMFLLATASNIYAVPTLSFSVDGGAAVVCADGASCDLSTTSGVVMVSNTFSGDYAVNITTGITKPVLPGATMDLNNVTITTLAPGAHTLQIMFSETGFTIPSTGAATSSGTASFGGTLQNLFGPSASTVSASAYFSSSNTLFGLGTLIGTSGTIPATGAFASNFTGPGPSSGTFSLTQVLNLSTTGPGTVFSGDFSLAVNPEPSSLVLMSSVLLFALAAARLKLRRS
jgi:hypothetical protein